MSSHLEFRINLHSHAPRNRVGHNVGNAVNNLRKVLHLGVNKRRDVANARQHLHAVRELNQLIVSWVRLNLKLVHEENARNAEAENWAAAAFEIKATVVALSPIWKVAAAALGEVSLAATVFPRYRRRSAVHIGRLLQSHVSEIASGAAPRRATAAGDAAGRISSASLSQAHLEGVWKALKIHDPSIDVPFRAALGFHLLRRGRREAKEAWNTRHD